jgi:hypothetical protein
LKLLVKFLSGRTTEFKIISSDCTKTEYPKKEDCY